MHSYTLLIGGSCDLALSLAAKLIQQEKAYPILTYRTETAKEKIQKTLGPKLNDHDHDHGHNHRYDLIHLDFAQKNSLDNLDKNIRIRADMESIESMVDFAQGDKEFLLANASEDELEEYFQQNIIFRGKLIRRMARIMLSQRKGKMIFVSSAAVLRAQKGQGPYIASKLAAEAMYKQVGLELGQKGIHSIIVRPSFIECGRGKRYLEREQNLEFKKDLIQRSPIGRILTMEDITDSLMFFLSDKAQVFNATEVTLDGGYSYGK